MISIGRTQRVEMPIGAQKDQKAGRTQDAQTGQPDAWLVIKSMQGPGNSFPVAVGETMIGRDEECAVRIDQNDEKASRKHAVIHRRAGDTRIYDKASTNGLYVNGQQVASGGKKLQSGDVVQVGNTELVFSELVRNRGSGASQETGRTVAVQPGPSEVEEQPRRERGRTRPIKLEEPATAWVIVQGPEGAQPNDRVRRVSPGCA